KFTFGSCGPAAACFRTSRTARAGKARALTRHIKVSSPCLSGRRDLVDLVRAPGEQRCGILHQIVALRLQYRLCETDAEPLSILQRRLCLTPLKIVQHLD